MAGRTEKTELEKRLEAEAAAEEAARVAQAAATAAETTPPLEQPAQPPTDEQVAALILERDQLKDQLLRLRADFDNYRKRTARETERTRKMAAEDLIRDLLPVLDNLDRALAHASDPSEGLAQGVEMVFKQLSDVLAARGVEAIPAVGEPFDPNVHEALSQQPSPDLPAHTVMTEWQRGYRIGDNVLRPAKVVVSGGPAEEAAPEMAPAETEEKAE